MEYHIIHRFFRITHMKRLILLILSNLFYCFPMFSQEREQPKQQIINQKCIYVSFDYVKHLIFPVQVSDIAIGEKNLILAERLEEAPHIVRLSAQAESFEEETNLTIVCIDGNVHTYRIKYLPEGTLDPSPNIYEDKGKWKHNNYQAEVSDLHITEFFFPSDIIYGSSGNEMSFILSSYNNQLKVFTDSSAVLRSNLFIIDKEMNTTSYEIVQGNGREYLSIGYDENSGKEIKYSMYSHQEGQYVDVELETNRTFYQDPRVREFLRDRNEGIHEADEILNTYTKENLDDMSRTILNNSDNGISEVYNQADVKEKIIQKIKEKDYGKDDYDKVIEEVEEEMKESAKGQIVRGDMI